MNKENIYNKIVEWENEHGESFVDNFGHLIKENTFMTWCLGRNYITPKKFNQWIQHFMKDKLEATDPNYYLYDSDGGDIEFAVVISDEWNMESQDEAHKILAEFISEIDIYKERLLEFLEE